MAQTTRHAVPVRPSAGRMLGRGAAKRCAACGAGHLFTGWFRMAERCPSCAYHFEREEGFFLGAYVLNLAVAQGLVMLLAVVPTIVLRNANPDASLVPVIVGAVAGVLLAPLAFYPWSKTLWVAVELIMRGVDETEPADVPLSSAEVPVRGCEQVGQATPAHEAVPQVQG